MALEIRIECRVCQQRNQLPCRQCPCCAAAVAPCFASQASLPDVLPVLQLAKCIYPTAALWRAWLLCTDNCVVCPVDVSAVPAAVGVCRSPCILGQLAQIFIGSALAKYLRGVADKRS
jgi:hypothetical protein